MATKKSSSAKPVLKQQQQSHIVEKMLEEYGPQTVTQLVTRTGLTAKRVQSHLDYICNEHPSQKNGGSIPKLKAVRGSHTKNGVYRLSGDGRGEDGCGAFRTEDWQKHAAANAKALVKLMVPAKRVASAKKRVKK